MSKGRKTVLAIVIIFIIYAVLNSPTQSASVTGNAWDQIKDGFSAVGTFFDTLISS
jgi:hypothetical protein